MKNPALRDAFEEAGVRNLMLFVSAWAAGMAGGMSTCTCDAHSYNPLGTERLAVPHDRDCELMRFLYIMDVKEHIEADINRTHGQALEIERVSKTTSLPYDMVMHAMKLMNNIRRTA